MPGVRAATDPEDWVISLSEADVSNVFNKINTAGPDWYSRAFSQSIHRTAGRYIHSLLQPLLVSVCNPHMI
jgi:hypothetical protein